MDLSQLKVASVGTTVHSKFCYQKEFSFLELDIKDTFKHLQLSMLCIASCAQKATTACKVKRSTVAREVTV